MQTHKVCPHCKEDKPASEYNTRKTAKGKTVLVSYCKPCMVIRATEYRKKTYTQDEYNAKMVEYRKTPQGALSHFKMKAKRLGLSETEVARAVAAYEAHDGLCEMCRTPLLSIYIDHCHDTLTFRGLLCNHCNTLLGFARNNPETLKAGIEYLLAHTANDRIE